MVEDVLEKIEAHLKALRRQHAKERIAVLTDRRIRRPKPEKTYLPKKG